MAGFANKWSAAFFLSLALLLMGAAALPAGDQDIVAANFLKFLHSDKKIISVETLDGNRFDAALPSIPVAHLYHLESGGYLLIATSKSLTPVKAYSLSSDFYNLPQNYRTALMEEMETQNRTLPMIDSRTTQGETTTVNSRRWEFLLHPDSSRLPLAYTPDTWLINTKWNQGYPFNKFTPKVNGQATLTGCINTALAQVMRYHQYPDTSKGVVSYTWNSQPMKTILYRTYNWDNMPEVLDAATPDDQVDEVARLISDLGIVNYTDFGVINSSASLQDSALIENFGYSNGLQSMNNQNADTFFTALKTEIDALRPVLLSFPGHMVVADGYASDGTGHKIHVNIGWGGSYDNFYFLDQPVQTGNINFITNPGDLDIYYYIKPCSGSDCAVNLEASDGMTGLQLTGRLDAAKDVDRYDVYLKGATTIRGSRGYGILGFYIYLYNMADGNLIESIDANATADLDISLGSLPAGKYIVKISLCNNSGYCYGNNAGYETYAVTLASGSLTDSEKAAIDQSIDIPPVINNTFRDILLNSANPSTYRILVDARDENGDTVTLQIVNSNASAFQTTMNKNILEITPVLGAFKIAGRITVKASASGRTSEKSFVVMVSNEDVGFGKTFEVKGFFENQNDFNLHKTILDGDCTITGYNGYSNQAFYSSVQDNSGNPVVPAINAPISGTFAKNLYRLGASLEQNPGGSGLYYPYAAGKNDRYALSISCPNADESISAIAGLLGIDLSGLQVQTGDLNGNGAVDLADAILTLKALSVQPLLTGSIRPDFAAADVNADGRIGLAEVIYILQKTAGLR